MLMILPAFDMSLNFASVLSNSLCRIYVEFKNHLTIVSSLQSFFLFINFSDRREVAGTLLTDQLHPPAGPVTADGQRTTPA